MTEDTTTTTPTADVSAPTPPNFKYGFVILVSDSGEVYIEKDLSVFSIPVDREASLIEIRRYLSLIHI